MASQPTTPAVRAARRAPSYDSPSNKSFEQYLQQAQSELSELGRAISANEAAFAQKIRQHVGDLQNAKDQLAREYKQRFDDLVDQRKEMEAEATSQQISDLQAARNDLKASYGEQQQTADGSTPFMTPNKLNAFRNAETQLVAEHNTRLAKQKSQIILNHAAEFEALSNEYDDKIGRLIGDKEKLSNDLSIEPSRFEQMNGQLDTQLQAERQSVASSPAVQRTPMRDTPLRSASPLAEPHRPRRDNGRLYQTPPQAQPYVPRQRNVSSPSSGSAYTDHDGPIARRRVESPRTSALWASPSDARDVSIDLGVEPEDYETAIRGRAPEEFRRGRVSMEVGRIERSAERMRGANRGERAAEHMSPRTSEPMTPRTRYVSHGSRRG